MDDLIVKTYAVATGKRPAGSRPVSILMISDLHGTDGHNRAYEILRAAEKMRPDFAVTCGDMMNAFPDFELTGILRFYKSLTGICPVFGTNGNHETKMRIRTVTFGRIYAEYAEELRRLGVAYLNNAHASILLDRTKFTVYGYEAPLDKYRRFTFPRLYEYDLREALGPYDDTAYNILLSHNPRFAKRYFAWGADLTLSGHFHGGLVRFGRQALVSPYGFPLPRYGYGMYHKHDKTLIVTSGAGDHSVPVRIGNPHEIVQIIVDSREEEAFGHPG